MHEPERAGRPSRRPPRQKAHGRRGTGLRARLFALAGRGDLVAATIFMLAAGLLGGGVMAWTTGYVLLVFAAIVVAIVFAWRDGFAAFAPLPLTGRLALAGIAVLPLLQLVPLPPAIWQALPGQAQRLGTLSLAGLPDSWQPLSLAPADTALVALLAIGFVAFVGLLLRLDDGQFRRILRVAFGLVLAGIAVGLLQVVGNGRPHLQVTNMGSTMLGFLANKNHMALVIACSIPLFALVVGRDLLARSGRPGSASPRDRRLVAALAYTGFALVCIVTTNSRAGLGLGALAGIVALAEASRGVPLRWRIAALAAVALAGVLVLSSSAFETVSSRVGDVGSDLRWQFAVWSRPLIERYALSGSGFGSFATLFAANEQLAWVKPTYVNAVHNDYLQIVLEAGVAGAAVAVLLLVSVVRCAGALRALPHRDVRRDEVVWGLTVAVLFVLHSGFDYPLRRPAAWVFFALALASVYRGWIGARASRAPVPIPSHASGAIDPS